jgi:hypothetical protein
MTIPRLSIVLILAALLMGSFVTGAWAATATLTWTDNSTNETSFSIERQIAGGAPYAEIGTCAANVATYTDTTLVAGTSYCYRVKAANAAGKSGPSNAACTIMIPTDLRITITE